MNGNKRGDPLGSSLASVTEWLVFAIAVVASVVLIVQVLWRCGSGFDFSDEGYYLNFVSQPWNYKVSITQFGFVYHPLYRLVGGDIVWLRRADILITLGLAFALCGTLLRKIASEHSYRESGHGLRLTSLAFALSTNTLAVLRFWVPTPNYNSLALQALLVAGIGLVLVDNVNSRLSALGSMLIGIAGWLAVMAKPTTGLALGALIGFYLLLTGKFKLRSLAISVGSAAIFVTVAAWLIDGSVGSFAWRLANGVEDARIMNGEHTLREALRWDGIVLSPNEGEILLVSTFLVFLATCLSRATGQGARLGASLLVIAAGGICPLMIFGVITPRLEPTLFTGILFLAAPGGVFLTLLVVRFRDFPRLLSFDRLALALAFGLFPLVYAFGSNLNYWARGLEAGIFWVLAAVVLAGSLGGNSRALRIFLPLAVAAQLCATTILFFSMENPFRQPQPLRQNDHPIQIAGTGSNLLVSRECADYLGKLHNMAARAGFRAGEPMLDLTGHFPGALYALGAKSEGRPWMIGGYPGSDALAMATLDRVSHDELLKSWILTEPAGPRKISADILLRYGINLTKDYTDIGTVESPLGEYRERFKQHLLRPIRQSREAQLPE